MRAVVTASPSDHDALYRSLADQAWLALAAVDAMSQLKKTFFSVSVHVV
jgi:hypothetical protein